MNDFICPKCNQLGLPSIYLPMCTACSNIERRKSGEIKDDNAAQHSVQGDEMKFDVLGATMRKILMSVRNWFAKRVK